MLTPFEGGMVTHAGCSCSESATPLHIAQETSRGLSAIAEFLVLFVDDITM